MLVRWFDLVIEVSKNGTSISLTEQFLGYSKEVALSEIHLKSEDPW